MAWERARATVGVDIAATATVEARGVTKVFGSGADSVRALDDVTLAIRPNGNGDVTASHLKWKTIKGSPFIPSPLLYGNHLYMINDIISVGTCYEATTGKMMWQQRLSEPVKHGYSASPIGVDGKVYFTNDAGDTFVLKAGPKYELLHVNRLGERTLASPALVEGKWYIRTEGHLYCIGFAQK